MPTSLAPPPLKPPLKWAGGKRWLVPHLAPLWKTNAKRRLVEPFCGGLAVALGLQPKCALLNDANPHLVNFYRWLQRGLVIESPMEHDEAFYYRQRARFNALIDADEARNQAAAEMFYYLNRTGYNGLCRFNRSGHFNVPFGRYKSIAYQRDFTPYRDALAGWAFSAGTFQNVPLQPDDFVYADPPYDVEFTQYSRHAFGWAEQVALVEWLEAHPGPIVLSNQATERIIDLYERHEFTLAFVDAPRRISRTGDRTPVREVIARRNL